MFARDARTDEAAVGDYPDWRISRFEGVWTDHEQGAMRHTGDVFDMAIKERVSSRCRRRKAFSIPEMETFQKMNRAS